MSHSKKFGLAAYVTGMAATFLVVAGPLHKAAFAAPSSPNDLDATYDRFESLERGLAQIDRLESRLNRQFTDPLVRSRSLDGDPDAIVADVTESISYLPYAGSLRAADGTLASRSGNAIDQAVLLATMLNRAGIEARIVTGQISAEDALRLVKSIERPLPDAPAFSTDDMQALRKGLSREIADLEGQSDAEHAALLSALDRQKNLLIDGLGDAAPPETSDLPNWTLESARDYSWVQYRDEPAGAWTDAHPAYPGGQAPPSLMDVEDAYYRALPDDAVQRVTIRMEMEIQVGDGDVKTLTLAELEEIPGSELARDPVVFSIMPDTLMANPQGDLTKAMEEAQFFAAGINGQRSHDPFSLSGVVVPPEAFGAESYGMADLFATVSDKGERAIAALSGDEDRDVLAIRKVKLVFISQAPSMQDRRDVRILYDAVSEDGTVRQRDSGDIAAELTGSYLIGARTGRVTQTGLAESMITQTRDIAHLIEYDIFRDMVRPDRLPPTSEVIADIDPSGPLVQLAFEETRAPRKNDLGALEGTLALFGLTAETMGMEVRPITMPERPLIRMVGTEAMINPPSADGPRYGMRRVVDLVSSPILAIGPDGDAIYPRAGLRAGVWMSRLEGDLSPKGDTGVSHDTERLLADAQSQGIDLIAITPAADEASGETSPVDGLDLPRDSLQAIRRDLESGFAVLAPKRLPDGARYGAWWRVDPVTGETLAMIGSGRGAELTEYLNVLQVGLSVASAISLADGTKECMSDDFNKKGGSLACCLAAGSFSFGSIGAGGAGALAPKHPAVFFAIAFLQVNMFLMEQTVGSSFAETCQR
ncbi:transglutaminase-like domain-containing protein [Henriciella sp.]|uniref:transglutaminase-like domain-containing protein n=1 Tax=Henriciella sp. TaxID=1968823 RepID=UPI0026182DA0|nr:transglutaminase-like domain-containing protein [Henriciella sp.]